MKKFLVTLVIVILSVGLGGAAFYTYDSHKELENKKEELKSAKEKASKKEETKEENKQKETNKEDKSTEEVSSNEEVQEQPQATEEVNQNNVQSTEQPQQENTQQQPTQEEDDVPVTDNEGNNIDDMDSEEFMSKYTEGMDPEEAETTLDMAKDDPNYEAFLRGQVEARQKGQGGVY